MKLKSYGQKAVLSQKMTARCAQPHCPLTPHPGGTPSNIFIYLIFLETKSLTYISPLTVCVYLRLNFSAALRKTIFFRTTAFRPFKVIQGHWFWSQSKARKRLPISTHHYRQTDTHTHTDGWTDGGHDDANSRSYCVACLLYTSPSPRD